MGARGLVEVAGRRSWPARLRAWLQEPVLWLGVAGFALAFTQAARRHLAFGSTGKDLGLFHQTHWLISRGLPPANTLLGTHPLADHAELVDWLLAPLQWLWPSPLALVAVQAAAVASGAVAVALLARERLGSRVAGLALGAALLLSIDLQRAVLFDWNPTTVGAGLLPWIAWSFARGKRGAFVLSVALVASCKENLVVYAGALCVVLALEQHLRQRRGEAGPGLSPKAGWAAAVVLGLVFFAELRWLFPHFREGGFRHLRYEQLGATGAAIAARVLGHPLDAVVLLVTPAAKLPGLLASLAGTLALVLVAPAYLLALAPVVLERFWSTVPNRWWGYHYGAALAVFAILAAIAGIERLTRPSTARPLCGRSAQGEREGKMAHHSTHGGLTAESAHAEQDGLPALDPAHAERSLRAAQAESKRGGSAHAEQDGFPALDPAHAEQDGFPALDPAHAERSLRAAQAKSKHALAVLAATLAVAFALGPPPLFARHVGYDQQPGDCRDARDVLGRIPPGASVAAQNQLLPHLSARPALYELGRPIRAEYVALHLGQGAWPFADDYPARLARELRASGGYGVVACAGKAILLARGATDAPCPALDAPGGL